MKLLFLDFETTGLDTSKDEPIQIGLLQTDEHFVVQQSFSSLIKPRKSIKELKTIVGHITGLRLDDLQSAPTIEEILPTIQSYFDNDTIIIGHNIGFDIAILTNYRTPPFATLIDTFPLAQACIPLVQSYSLEALIHHLESNASTPQQKIFHDALKDCAHTADLFAYCIRELTQLLKTYPPLNLRLARSQLGICQLIPLDLNVKQPESLPPLKKTLPTDRKISFPDLPKPINLKADTHYYVWWTSLKNLLKYCLNLGNKTIISFSNKRKNNLTRELLYECGQPNVWYLKNEQQIDETALKALINKKTFEDFEVLFLIKYCIHWKKEIGVLHLTNPNDYKIMHALQGSTIPTIKPITLCSHQQLYHTIQEGHIPNDAKIIFMDSDRRYKSYNVFAHQTRNRFEFLTTLENTIYQYTLLDKQTTNLKQLHNAIVVLFGIFCMDAGRLFKGHSDPMLTIDPIITHYSFVKTSQLFTKIYTEISEYFDWCEATDCQTLTNYLNQLHALFNDLVTVERVIFQQGWLNFTIKKNTQYSSYEEFHEQFKNNETYFFSTTDSSFIHWPKDNCTLPRLERFVMENPSHLKPDRALSGKNFLLAQSKAQAQQLFEIVQKRHKSDKTLIVENVTGSTTKCVAQAMHHESSIIIGGYEFILQCIAQGLKFDRYGIFGTLKWFQSLLVQDISYYANHSINN